MKNTIIICITIIICFCILCGTLIYTTWIPKQRYISLNLDNDGKRGFGIMDSYTGEIKIYKWLLSTGWKIEETL